MILWFVISLYKFFHDANLSIFFLHGLKQFETSLFFFKTHIYQFFDKSQNNLKPSYIFILKREILGYSLKATGTSSGCVYNESIFFFTKPAIIYSFLNSPTYRRPYRAKQKPGFRRYMLSLKYYIYGDFALQQKLKAVWSDFIPSFVYAFKRWL